MVQSYSINVCLDVLHLVHTSHTYGHNKPVLQAYLVVKVGSRLSCSTPVLVVNDMTSLSRSVIGDGASNSSPPMFMLVAARSKRSLLCL